MAVIADLIRSRELLFNLTRREVKGKYKSTALGQLWSLASPIAQMVIFSVVFSRIIRLEPAPGDPSGLDIFALWLMCGLLPWSYFANVLNANMSSLVANENLIKKVWFPRVVLPVSTSAALLVSWALEMAVLLVALVIFSVGVLPWVPVTLVFMVFLAMFATGIGLALSVVNVYFRDTQHLMAIVLQAWFYLTPVIYPVRIVESESEKIGALIGGVTVLDLYELNPMERFVAVFRALLYDNRWPELSDVTAVVLWTAGALLIGGWLFAKHEKRLAEVL